MKGPGNTAYVHASDNYSWMVTIGSRKFPERPAEGVSEAFLRLRQAAATYYGQDDMSISPSSYMAESGGHFINGLDLEKCGAHNVSHTGISTKDGSIVQLELKNAPVSSNGTDMCIIHMVYDGLLQLKDGSADVFE